jgi:diguanylate cyclase (GGDEF)-like protein/PAS domain S-box-containing protein
VIAKNGDSPQASIGPDTLTENLIRGADGLFLGLLRNELVGIYIIQDDRFRYVNPRFAQMFGYAQEEICGKLGPMDLTAPEFRKRAQQEIDRRVRNEATTSRYAFDGVCKDGNCIRVEIFGTRTELNGRPAIIGMIIDNTDRHKAEQEVESQLHFIEQLIDAIPNPMYYKDEHGYYLGCNRAFEEYIGKTRQEIFGKSVHEISPPDLAERYYVADRALFDSPGVQTYEAIVQTASGDRKDVVFHKATFNKADGTVGGLVGVIHDITERKRSEETIWREANYDPLTQLPNRRLFLDRLQQDIKKAERSKSPLSLLFIDLDRFKEVNDTLGHEAGDRLLAEAAKRIVACVRRSDTVARLGGDEFVIIMPDIAEPPHLENTANHIIQALQQPFRINKETAYVSASIGITFFPRDADNMDTLLINADQAMYDAKAQGKSRFSFFRPTMQAAMLERLQLGNELRSAMENGQLELYYQPVYNLANGHITQVEALLRWNHPQRGQVPPAQFIPIAEDIGLINRLGNRVFRQAVAMAKRMEKLEGGNPVPISINKSPRQILSGKTNQVWLDYLRQENLPGTRLGIEITENLLMDERPEVTEKLQQFHKAGIHIALDDFGTGYSAMGYLKRFHIDYLKIDGTFVHGMVNSPSDRAIIEAIIAMAHKLGIKTIAEGIETEEQRALLAKAGCDYGQGFALARPMPEQELIELLAHEQHT